MGRKGRPKKRKVNPKIKYKEFIFDGMMYLVAAGLGFTTLEKFSKKS